VNKSALQIHNNKLTNNTTLQFQRSQSSKIIEKNKNDIMKYSNQNTIIRNQMIEDGPKDSFKN